MGHWLVGRCQLYPLHGREIRPEIMECTQAGLEINLLAYQTNRQGD